MNPRRRLLAAAALAALLLAASCSGDDPPPRVPFEPIDSLRLVEVARGLSSPVYATAPAGDPRLFIVEQAGRIRVLENGTLRPEPYLDITDRVASGGERGLLSLAFHPQYAQNGHLFVDFTDSNGDTRVERFSVTADPNVADPGSAKLVLFVEQPYSNHNGGLVMFGPDGMLYIGMGDGGAAGDPHDHAQNRSTLLGKLLRIDVDGGDPYAIPPDNPFVNREGMRGEIWAYGLRNPWRFAFDRSDGVLYVADVGQSEREEVNAVPAADPGLNYGWDIFEGTRPFEPEPGASGLVVPVVEYGHDEGCSVTGGFAYRGLRMPALLGHYFFSDYCSGFLRSFRYANGHVSDLREWTGVDAGSVLSFGEDAAGELYICSADGRIHRIEGETDAQGD